MHAAVAILLSGIVSIIYGFETIDGFLDTSNSLKQWAWDLGYWVGGVVFMGLLGLSLAIAITLYNLFKKNPVHFIATWIESTINICKTSLLIYAAYLMLQSIG